MIILAGWGEQWYSFLRLGTDLFLVTSAFLGALVTTRARKTGVQYLVDRLARLVPFYWLMTAFVSLCVLMQPSLFGATVVTWETLFKSLFFIPFSAKNGMIIPIVNVAWTLTYLVEFAFVYAISIKIVGIDRAPKASIVILMALIILGFIVPNGNVIFDFYTSQALFDLVLGVGVYLIYSRFGDQRLRMAIVLLVVAATFLVLRPFYWDRDIIWRSISNGIPCAMILVAALIMEGKGLSANWPWVTKLANATYAIYLCHFFVAKGSSKFVTTVIERYDLGGYEPLFAMIVLISALASAVVIGLIIYPLVERPLTAAAVRFVAKARERRAEKVAKMPALDAQ